MYNGATKGNSLSEIMQVLILSNLNYILNMASYNYQVLSLSPFSSIVCTLDVYVCVCTRAHEYICICCRAVFFIHNSVVQFLDRRLIFLACSWDLSGSPENGVLSQLFYECKNHLNPNIF